MYQVEPTDLSDVRRILELYQTVVRQSRGIIRIPTEVTFEYIEDFVIKSLRTGLCYIVNDPDNKERILAELHAYQYGIAAFRHILTDLTIVVHPTFQGQKIGKLIFTHFLNQVAEKMPHILRVELFVREENVKAVEFYQKLGFVEEGRHQHKIKNQDNSLETPIEMTWFNPQYKNE